MDLHGLFGAVNAFIDKQVAARQKQQAPEPEASKLESLFGCSNCNYNEAGCKHCYDTPFASRPAARARPKEGRYHDSLPPAPTFHPTAEQWQDPFAYLSSIAPEATKAGIALIVPPKGWEPPIQMLDQQTGQLRTDLKVPVRIQPTHLLCRRWPTPAGAPPKTPKRGPNSSSEDGSDWEHEAAAAASEDGGEQQQSTPKKSNAVTGRCSKAGMQQHKAALAAAAAKAAAAEAGEGDEDENGEGLGQQQILNPAHLDAVATAAQATDGQFGYEHLEEPLSLFDFHRYADWAKRRHFNGPVLAGLRQPGSSSSKQTTTPAAAAAEGGEQQQQADASATNNNNNQQIQLQQPPVVSASTAWRAYPATEAVREARGVAGSYTWSEDGAVAAGAGGSGSGGVEWEEPSVAEVEAEFWRIVEAADEQVEALYGQDIDTATYCSAFPTIRELAERQSARVLQPNTNPDSNNKQQQHYGCVQELAATIGASDPDDPCHCVSTCDCGTCQLCVLRAYSAHPWNINNIPQAKGSVLRFVREDVGGKPITGLMVPWVYVGSCFSAFCWHIEDHGLYSINYNHMGSPKVWYGVPAAAAAALDASMRDALPHLFDKDHLLLHKLITMLSPAQLAARGVPVCRAVQVPGSFVVTFPDAYHAGFNSGFNIAEAVNFAAPNWLPFGSSSVVRYRNEERYMTFSHDAMLINVVKEAIQAAATSVNPRVSAAAAAAAKQLLALPAPPAAAGAGAGDCGSGDGAGGGTAWGADRPGVCPLKRQFQQRLDATVAELGEAEAAAAGRQWWQQQQPGGGEGSAGTVAVTPAAVRMVGPPGSTGSQRLPAVDFSSTPLDSSFWWAWYPDESWADAADVAERTAAEVLQGYGHQQQQQQQQHDGGVGGLPRTPTAAAAAAQQQKAGDGHHLAAASAQHHQEGQRERVFTMRGAVGGGGGGNGQGGGPSNFSMRGAVGGGAAGGGPSNFSMRGAVGGGPSNFSMRGAIGGGNKQQQVKDDDDEEDGDGEFVPGAPAAGAAAAAAAAGPPPRVVAAAARSLALAAFAPAAAKPDPKDQPRRIVKAAAAARRAAAAAAAAAGGAGDSSGAIVPAAGDADAAPRPSVAEQIEAAVKALTTYTLCLAEARRQKLLVQPPSPQLAPLALGELALRVELEQQRQAALLLKAGISRSQLMAGSSAATDPVSGVHINTQGVECAVCGSDLSLAAVVSSEEPGRAVCVAHAEDLDGPRSAACFLLRYPPGYLDALVASGLRLIPGAAAGIEVARRRQSWVAAGRFYGGTVLHRAANLALPDPAATAGGAIPAIKLEEVQQEQARAQAAAAAAAAAATAEQQPQKQQWKEQVPVFEVKLLGPLYDPAALDQVLFEDLDGGDSSSQSLGWEEDDDGAAVQDTAQGGGGRSHAAGGNAAAVGRGAGAQKQNQQQRQRSQQKPKQNQQAAAAAEGDSGGDASSGSWWQEDLEAEDAFGFYTFGGGGAEGSGPEDKSDDDSDDDFRPSRARSRKRRRPAAGAGGGGSSRKRSNRGSGGAAAAKQEQQEQQQADADADVEAEAAAFEA